MDVKGIVVLILVVLVVIGMGALLLYANSPAKKGEAPESKKKK